jgi:hypothetical protein
LHADSSAHIPWTNLSGSLGVPYAGSLVSVFLIC